MIKELLELPRGEIGPGYMELLARELAGPDGGGTSPGASANTFERQLQSVVAHGAVPAELRAYVTDYFVAIAGDETRREP